MLDSIWGKGVGGSSRSIKINIFLYYFEVLCFTGEEEYVEWQFRTLESACSILISSLPVSSWIAMGILPNLSNSILMGRTESDFTTFYQVVMRISCDISAADISAYKHLALVPGI